MSETPLKVALLGAGGRGRSVLKNWVDVAKCRVTAIVDPNPDSIRLTREILGDAVKEAESVTDVQGWLGRADADVVTINSWDPQHGRNAIDCFNAGLNVHVAKPMTQTTEEADAVVRAWKQSGKLGVVDMQIRTSALVEQARQIIDSGAIGKVRLVTCFDMVGGLGGCFFREHRSRRKDMIRSLTLAKGVHFLDLCNGFMDDVPVSVFATGGRDVFGGDKPDDLKCADCADRQDCPQEGLKVTIGGMPFPKRNSLCVYAKEADVNDNCVAAIDYRGGGRASYVEAYFSPEYQTLYDIIGDRGALLVRYAMDNRHYMELRRCGSASVEHINVYADGAHGGGDVRIIKQMAAALREGKPMRPDILDGRYAVALAEAIDKSIETRMPVAIPPAPMDR